MDKKTLIIGYGNVDREDDGVAWHILRGITKYFNSEVPLTFEDEFPVLRNNTLFLLFTLQLTPELSETISNYDRVCFIDAHTGMIPEDIRMIHLDSTYQPSPMTHHMTPQTCLALAETLYMKKPEAILLSIRAYNFGFSQNLSNQTAELCRQAQNLVMEWLSNSVLGSH